MSGPRLLYVCSNGVDEPLVESQVLSYLRRLRPGLTLCHLVTLERHRHSESDAAAIAARLAADGIDWTPLRSQPRLGPLNPVAIVRRGSRLVRRLHERIGFDLCHARSFLPGRIGLGLKRSHRVPLLFDMRGFWALEKRSRGRLRPAAAFRAVQRLETQLHHEADQLVSLTRAGRDALRSRGVATPITVIPCCVDLDRFAAAPPPAVRSDPQSQSQPTGQPLRLVSVGSLGTGYLVEATLSCFAAARRLHSDAGLTLVTREAAASVRRRLDAASIDPAAVRIVACSPAEVAAEIRAAHFGLCMIAPSPAKVASSPTKLAEYLACGRPVLATAECGDVQADLTTHRVGLTVSEHTRDSDGAAVRSMLQLLEQPDLATRCRQTAQTLFSVDTGVERYAEIYAAMGSG